MFVCVCFNKIKQTERRNSLYKGCQQHRIYKIVTSPHPQIKLIFLLLFIIFLFIRDYAFLFVLRRRDSVFVFDCLI